MSAGLLKRGGPEDVLLAVTVSAPERPLHRDAGTPQPTGPGAGAGDATGRVPRWVLPALVVLGAALRAWRATTHGLTFDESYTSMAARRPLGDLLAYLRHTDLHPPLDYILRIPFARAGASDFVMRFPSVVFSTAALALFAWWMRKRGWVGVTATALMAVSTFQLTHGGEVRMYALLQLVGVAAAMVAEQWVRHARPWHAGAIAGLVLVAVFDHVSGFLLAGGLFAVAGIRNDRDAWRWRVGAAASAALWLPLWGPAFLEQRHLGHSSWMPRTTPGVIADTVTRHLVMVEGIAAVVFVAVVAGGVCLVRRDRSLGRVWIACAAIPFAAAAVIGLFEGFLFDRTLTFASWAVPLAVAYLVGEALRRWKLIGAALAVCVVLLTLSDSATFFGLKRWDYDLSIEQLQRVAKPGDVIAVRPPLYGELVKWRIGVRGEFPATPTDVAGIPWSSGLRIGHRDESGRVWMLAATGSKSSFRGFRSCAPKWTDDVTQIVCLERQRT